MTNIRETYLNTQSGSKIEKKYINEVTRFNNILEYQTLVNNSYTFFENPVSRKKICPDEIILTVSYTLYIYFNNLTEKND